MGFLYALGHFRGATEMVLYETEAAAIRKPNDAEGHRRKFCSNGSAAVLLSACYKTYAMNQSLKVVTGFTLVPVEERRNVAGGLRAAVASVRQFIGKLPVRTRSWLRAPAPLHSRIAGEAFARWEVLACYGLTVLFLVVLGLVGSMKGGVL